MASGDVVIQIVQVMPPTATFAALSVRVGGSTPAEQVPCWAFDAAAIEYLDVYVFLRGYAGGGLTLTLGWMGATATTGVVRWGAAFRRIADDAEDVDTAHTYDFNTVDDTTASATGEVVYFTITFTDGADMDSWANGEGAILRIRREATHANDTMAGDAQLVFIEGQET